MRLGAPRRISAAQALGVLNALGEVGLDNPDDQRIDVALSIEQLPDGNTVLRIERHGVAQDIDHRGRMLHGEIQPVRFDEPEAPEPE